jgi:hypothetical protein
VAYDPGDTVELTYSPERADANTTAVLTLELPDGTSETPTVSGPTDGQFVVSYVPEQAGRYGVRWVASAPADATSDVFDVREQFPRYLLSLADAKRHLNITSSRHDEELRGHVEAATGAVEYYLGQAVVRRPVTERLSLSRASRIMLERFPVISVTSATLDGDEADVSEWYVSPVGALELSSAMSGELEVTYVAGRSIIPAEYLRAAEMIVEGLYKSQRKPAAGPPASPGGMAELEPDDYGVVIPPKARELLGVSGPQVA